MQPFGLGIQNTENKVVSVMILIDNHNQYFPLELNTMPGWAGSSQYFNRYMDSENEDRNLL